MVRDSTDAYSFIFGSVDERVRKTVEWKEPSVTRSARAEPGIRRNDSCGPSELGQKGDRYRSAGLLGVEGDCPSKFFRCLG